MNNHTYKIIELVGSSESNIEDAIHTALSKASESVRNSRWFEVTQIRGYMEGEKVAYWQVGLKLGFNVEGSRRSTEKPAPQSVSAEKKKEKPPAAAKYRCTVCGYIYDPAKGDPDNGVKPGTAFDDLPDDWVCPECGADKDQFEKIEEE